MSPAALSLAIPWLTRPPRRHIRRVYAGNSPKGFGAQEFPQTACSLGGCGVPKAEAMLAMACIRQHLIDEGATKVRTTHARLSGL